MEAATQHLKSRIDNETDIGVEQIRNITCQITDCLNVIHKKGFVHGDIKPSNILERGNVFTLSKLEASSNIADKHFACTTKYSTGYLPPEMFWIDQSNEVKVRTSSESDDITYEKVLAHPSQDIWALGCILYQLYTGHTLFHNNNKGNIHEQRDLLELISWESHIKHKKLSNISDRYVRNLLSQLLSKDPQQRPNAEQILLHPFITGANCTRLQGEKAMWDIYLSYNIDNDSKHVEMLYDELITEGFTVWWDKKCLLPEQQSNEEELFHGLMNSAFIICLISRNTIMNINTIENHQNFDKVKTPSAPFNACDRLLLEWKLALELRERGLLFGICPIMIGDKDPLTGEYSNYFASGCHPEGLSDISVEHVDRMEELYLERAGLGLGLGSSRKHSGTVKGVLQEILNNQSACIQGVIEVALENVTNLIISIIISNKRRRKEEINYYNNDYDIKNEIEEKNKIISKMKFRNDILKRSLEDQMKVDEELQLELEDKNRTILELQELIKVQNEELEELKRSDLDYLSTNGTLQGIVVYQKKKMIELQKTINDLRLEHSMPLLQEGQDANSSTSTNTSKEEIIPIESQKII